MKKTLWLSYDLGVRGDYEGLYTWLDGKNAIECGDSLAFIKTDISDDIIESLKKDIEEHIETNKKTRIYIIYRDNNKMKGKFLIGSRKAAPWTGYAGADDSYEEEAE